jgi:hypothetical protein
MHESALGPTSFGGACIGVAAAGMRGGSNEGVERVSGGGDFDAIVWLTTQGMHSVPQPPDWQVTPPAVSTRATAWELHAPTEGPRLWSVRQRLE